MTYDAAVHGVDTATFVPGPTYGHPHPPYVVLHDTKFVHNLAAAVRTCSCFGIGHVLWTGRRALPPVDGRMPRELRMRGYLGVSVLHVDDDGPADVGTPVAVELRAGSEGLPDFVHPPDAVYIFGPEDGSIPRRVLARCHRFVSIPTGDPLNLATAVAVVLYDRLAKAGR